MAPSKLGEFELLVLLAILRNAAAPYANRLREDLEDAVRLDWDRLAVVPVDGACLDRAVDLARAQPLRLSDALHLAAADRLPRPVRFLTFDAGQIPVALSLGFDVIST